MQMELDCYTVVDVETPNVKPNSVCQIALIEVKQGQVVWKYDTLINPEDTRKYVIGAFEMLYTKREDRPDKKHGAI